MLRDRDAAALLAAVRPSSNAGNVVDVMRAKEAQPTR
jgi:hypothetical protein